MMVDLNNPLTLRTGHLDVLFENGFLRYIRFGNEELLRMIYFAVRDSNWGTVPHHINNATLKKNPNGFLLQYDCTCKQKEIDFRWKCKIMGMGNTLTFEINGKAYSRFDANRIGFCVLHPSDKCTGKEVRITHSDGSSTTQTFPEIISPHQPFKDIKGMAWETDTSEIRLFLEGEVFETEDQRNWLDASYKTYCTPLELPFPLSWKKGKTVSQRIRLDVIPRSLDTSFDQGPDLKLNILGNTSPLPRLGVETNGRSLSNWEVQKLKDLQLSFLRVEIRLDGKEENVESNLFQAKRLQLPIELILFTNNNAKTLGNRLKKINWEGLIIMNILPLSTETSTTKRDFLEKVRPVLRATFGNVPIGGGTDHYFTQINRERPPSNSIDFLSFSANPQVHASDDLSILETAQTFTSVIKSARMISEGKPIHISPITLKPRSNPDATVAISEEEQARARLDHRHKTPLNALWTLASLKNIIQGGAAQATFFQTLGDEGLLSDSGQSLFPIYEVFAFLGEKKNALAIHTESSHPLVFEGLILEENGKRSYILANFTEDPILVQIEEKSIGLKPKELKFMD
ncbi:hypothetical protein [Ulvibacterium sp.]|uniref:hypothetical protein n=1 Tax=Ulvibacterium sp. TaxID=2665914 RepID=UPI003BAC2659